MEKDEEQWYVMRAYKNETKAEKHLSGKYGLKHFIPKEQAMRTCNGKKVICTVPVIHSLVFVYAAHKQIVAFKKEIYNDLQFVIWKHKHNDNTHYLTVPNDQMNNFIGVCEQKEKEVTFYRPDQINIEKGKKVRVHGGTFDKLEGIYVKVAKKRNKQFVVIIPEILAASTTVDPEYLEIIN